MKKRLVCLSISFSFFTFAQNDTIKSFFGKGELKEICYLDNTGSGQCFVYYQNGALNSTFQLLNNTREGLCTTFNKQQKLISEENFSKGSLNGYATYYYESDSGNALDKMNQTKLTYRKGNYLDDFYEGEWISFYQNGEIKQKGNYSKGSPEGIWSFYTLSGVLESSITYKEGKKNGEQLIFDLEKHRVTKRQYFLKDKLVTKRKFIKNNL